MTIFKTHREVKDSMEFAAFTRQVMTKHAAYDRKMQIMKQRVNTLAVWKTLALNHCPIPDDFVFYADDTSILFGGADYINAVVELSVLGSGKLSVTYKRTEVELGDCASVNYYELVKSIKEVLATGCSMWGITSYPEDQLVNYLEKLS